MPLPLSPDDLVYELRQATDPWPSPDGSRVLYSLTGNDRTSGKATSQLWWCSSAGDGHRQLTREGSRSTGGRWSPDGQTIAYVSDRQGPSSIWVLPVDGGEPRLLLTKPVPLSGLAWSPDGRMLAFQAAAEGDLSPVPVAAAAAPAVRVVRRLDYKADIRGWVGEARQQIHLVDVATGEERQLTNTGADLGAAQWSPDGRWLASRTTTRQGSRSALTLIDATDGSQRLVSEEGGTVSLWAWSPSGRQVALAGTIGLSGQPDLFVHGVAAAVTRLVVAAPFFQPDAGFPGRIPPSHPHWLDEETIVWHGLHHGRSGLYRVHVYSGRIETVAEYEAVLGGLAALNGGRWAVVTRSALTGGGDICRVDLESGDLQPLTSLNEAVLAVRPPAVAERLSVDHDGRTLDAWVLRPADLPPGQRLPLILDVHGGPQACYGPSFTSWQQCWATHGFAVVFGNPRGSTSQGRGFVDAVVGDWADGPASDLLAIVEAASTLPYVDGTRVGAYGYSYGGYMTAWLAGHSERFKALISGAPVFDFESMYGTSDIGWWFFEHHFARRPHEADEKWAHQSPSTAAHQARTPTLIVHGEADERCPIGQGEQMFVTLHRAGCEVEFARYPGGSHEGPRFGPPAHTVDFLARTLAWFQRHLVGGDA